MSAKSQTDVALAPGTGLPRNAPETPLPHVSFVIPAYNAATTLERTLDSLTVQTFPAWEAIVVDDGSSDGTAGLVEEVQSRDPRIRLLSQPNAGVSRARNAGITAARGEWLVFLDADDWISRNYLSAMLAALRSSPNAEVACCGYARTDAAGRQVLLQRVPDFRGDPFASFARQAMGTIHSFVVKRSLVLEVGGFDPSLRACEDWDLYQRVFRTGAELAQTPEILAFYGCRRDSLSRDAAAMLADTRTVFLRGCARDPRVRRPSPRYAEGVAPRRSVEYSCLWIACWCAATSIGSETGSGRDDSGLLDNVRDFSDTADLAQAIYEGLVIGSNLVGEKLASAWPRFSGNVRLLVDEIERRSGQPGSGRAIFEELAALLVPARYPPGRMIVGSTLFTRFDMAMLCQGLKVPASVDSVFIQIAGRGPLQLPVIGSLTGADIRRALWWWLKKALWSRRVALRSFFPRPGALPQSNKIANLIAEEFERVTRSGIVPLNDPPSPAMRTIAEAASFKHPESYWEGVFEHPDPWNYSSPYEQLKYERTLGILPDAPFPRALELACAEGHFTALLAPRVGKLTAVDISQKALDRARERCHAYGNVEFSRMDFFSSALSGPWDLIVCSEVLYFLNDTGKLRELAVTICDALEPGGYFLTTHANLLADEKDRTGFEWDHQFGSATIARVFGETPELQHVGALRTELYRIDLFRRNAEPSNLPLNEQGVPLGVLPRIQVQRSIVWGGAIRTRAECNLTQTTSSLPVLMYHRIANGPPDRFCVTPECFEEQLRFLRRRGFRSVSLKEWSAAAACGGTFAGQPILLTFDDGTVDFFENAAPILDRNSFSAVVFVVTDKAGQRADSMTWNQIAELSRNGVEFGSHLATHTAANRLATEQLLREGARSRATLEQVLNLPIETVALPYGITGGRVRNAMRACGYTTAFSAEYGMASTLGDPLDTPRIEISGGDDLDEFARKLQWSIQGEA